MKNRSLFCGTLLALALLFPSFALADIAPLQASGGMVAPKAPHETIRMEAEEVTMRLDEAGYTVEAVFVMANTGEATTEWVGFPKGEENASAAMAGMGSVPDFTRFLAWVDGKPVEFKNEGGRWVAAQVSFPAHAITTIRVLYEANYYRGSYTHYIIGTGAAWKDSIGKASFTVDGSAIGGSKNFSANLNAPNSRKMLSEKGVRIDVAHYEPDSKAALRVSIHKPQPGQ